VRRRATADEASALASGAKLLFLQFFNDWVFNIYEYILISCFTCQLPVFPRVQKAVVPCAHAGPGMQ